MASAVHERYVHFQHDGSHAPLLRSYSSTSEELLDDDEEALLQPPSRWSRWQAEAKYIYVQGKGMILVTLAQFFAANMNVMTKYLEMDGPHGHGMDPFQILFARMSITVVASYLYMLYARVPDPFGRRGVLGLLALRAVGGFFGVFGLYYSVKYLDLSEATVLTFLAPILTCYATSRFMPHESFGWKQQLAGLVSLGGVILIAQPFSSKDGQHKDKETEVQHFLAILLALVGVLGATCAYTTLRLIGKQVHPLVSVTYFSAYTTVISCIAMLVIPSVDFRLPATAFQWALLIGLGVCGFLLQFLLAAGLAYVPPSSSQGNLGLDAQSQSSAGNRATSMLYTQMLFALVYDKLVWGKTLSPMSWAGSVLILASAIYVAVARDGKKPPVSDQQYEHDHQDEV